MRTVWFLIALFMMVTLGDHYTTWACLHEPISGWTVIEANPIAKWAFGVFGLVPALVLDLIATTALMMWLGLTKSLGTKFKVPYLLFAIAFSAWAVYNNYQGMIQLGIV